MADVEVRTEISPRLIDFYVMLIHPTPTSSDYSTGALDTFFSLSIFCDFFYFAALLVLSKIIVCALNIGKNGKVSHI